MYKSVKYVLLSIVSSSSLESASVCVWDLIYELGKRCQHVLETSVTVYYHKIIAVCNKSHSRSS